MVKIRCGSLHPVLESVEVALVESQRADEVVRLVLEKLQIGRPAEFVLAEALLVDGQVCKERRLEAGEKPAKLQAMWPQTPSGSSVNMATYDFFIRRKDDLQSNAWVDSVQVSRASAIVNTLVMQKQQDCADLCNLPDLNEKTMLAALKKRFQDGQIYTYVNSILIAMNPFRFLPIYNPKHMKMYERCKLSDLPPHIFAIADGAYQSMLQQKVDQCIVISGESGSGKTESTNLVLHQLLHLSQKGYGEGGIEQVIAASGPVLQAFGNAKTLHNDNSSRFGMFIQLFFKDNGFVHTAALGKVLLEKSRIVSVSRNERNYHIFYYLFAGLEQGEKNKLFLQDVTAYRYLNQSDCYKISGVDHGCLDECQEYKKLSHAMELVGFAADVRWKIFSVLAAVLHLGNVEYALNTENNYHDAVSIKNPEVVQKVCELLKVPESELFEALKQKKTRAGVEMLRKNYTIADAVATRDSMTKCLYAALFDWIVLQINKSLMSSSDLKAQPGNSIGLLDIFGFEDMDKNNFEQFFINFANEHLHFYFNQHVFKLEQEEYKTEGIVWKDIDYIDNTGCLDLFAKKPTGLIYLLDEECSFPGGTNESLLEKFNANHSGNPCWGSVPLMKQQKTFFISHYAGRVQYSIAEFREKNLDVMPQDLLTILKHSKLPLVRELVGYDLVALYRWAVLRAFFMAVRGFTAAGRRNKKMGSIKRKRSQQPQIPQANKPPTATTPPARPVLADVEVNGIRDSTPPPADKTKQILEKTRLLRTKLKVTKTEQKRHSDVVIMKSMARRSLYSSRQNKTASVGSQFNLSLQKLIESLGRANPFFIRCIKSNNEKKPLEFDDSVVLRQLRYTGMLATINIRKSGYNYRLVFQDFIQQYSVILPKGKLSSREDILALFQSLDINAQNYQLGKTKVFFREWEKLLLDQAMNAAILRRIVSIQRFVKKTLHRLRVKRSTKAAITIQSNIRMVLAKKRLRELRTQMYAAIRIQAMFRGFQIRKQLQMQGAAVNIQRVYRGHMARKMYSQMRGSKNYSFSESVDDARSREEVTSPKAPAQDSVDGLVGDMKVQFTLEDANDDETFEYRPKDVNKVVLRPGNVHHHHDTVESQLSKDKDTVGRESTFADDESEDLDGNDLSQHRMSSDTALMPPHHGHFEHDRSPVGHIHKLPVQNPPEEEPYTTLTKSVSDSILLELTGPDTVHLTDKKISKTRLVPVAIPESIDFDDEQLDEGVQVEENIDKVIPIDSDEETNDLLLNAGHLDPGDAPRPKKTIRKHPPLSDSGVTGKHGKLYMAKRKLKKMVVRGRPSESDEHGPVTPKSPGTAEYTLLLRQMSEDDSKRDKVKQKRVGAEKGGTLKKGSLVETSTTWKVSEWQLPSTVLAENAAEMMQLEQFVYDKLQSIGKTKESVFYDVFWQSLNDFCKNLVSDTSLALTGQPIKRIYKDAMANFNEIMKTHVKARELKEDQFDLTFGSNGFRSILDEYCRKKDNKELPEIKEKVNKHPKKVKKIYALEYNGHKYLKRYIYERAMCDLCQKTFELEKAYLCQLCQLTLHKKCATKMDKLCKDMVSQSTKMFGVALCRTELGSEDKLPPVIERVLTHIEQTGLYTEGLYRKIGAKARINQIIKDLDTNPDSVDFNECVVHDLSSVFKQYLRDLPIPIMTFDLYDEFMRVAEISNPKDRARAIYATVDKLPQTYHRALERIIFHLVRVAANESANRMTSTNLGVIFGPCLLRCDRNLEPTTSLAHVQLQTACVECLIEEQKKKWLNRLDEIRAIDTATQATVYRLSLIRTNEQSPRVADPSKLSDISEEKTLQDEITSLQIAKESLTFQLATLDRGLSSSEEDLLSVSDRNHTLDGTDSLASFDLPVSPLGDHLTKTRVHAQHARLPPSRVTSCDSSSMMDTSIDEEA